MDSGFKGIENGGKSFGFDFFCLSLGRLHAEPAVFRSES
jgi:hypothetical protein